MDATDRAPSTRRRRRIALLGTAALVAALIGGNAVLVDGQSAAAAGPPTISVDGQDIAVHDDGPRDAPPLVLVHGFASSSRIWDRVVPTLAASRRVVRVDLLGHGRSAKPAGADYGIPAQARRVAAVLDRLHITGAVVVGHSTGGLVVTSLAEQRRDLVAAVALVDTGPSIDAFVSNGLTGELLLTPLVGQLLWRVRTDGLIRRAASTAVSRPGFAIPQDVVDDAGAMTYDALRATSIAGTDFLTSRPVPARLAPLHLPLLVIFGQDDQRWYASSAEQYRAVPGATITVLPGIGHSVMLEDPAHAAELLLGVAAGH